MRDFLKANFPDMWIGRGGPLSWPPRSPGLTPLHFILGFVKNVVYPGDRPTTLEELRGPTWREVEYHLDVCRAKHGAHIELHWPSSETRVFLSQVM